MLKYIDTAIVFSEIPDEITLAISISGCRIRCKNCHSQYLWDEIGTELTVEELKKLIDANSGITCVCFMGGDQDLETLCKLANSIKLRSDVSYKIAWYTGREDMPSSEITQYFDYIKLGPYIEEKGPLTSRTTNQKLYARGSALKKMSAYNNMFYDITDKFWRNGSQD